MSGVPANTSLATCSVSGICSSNPMIGRIWEVVIAACAFCPGPIGAGPEHAGSTGSVSASTSRAHRWTRPTAAASFARDSSEAVRSSPRELPRPSLRSTARYVPSGRATPFRKRTRVRLLS